MNIPISGTNSLITLPASAPLTLCGMKKKHKETFVTFNDIFNRNRNLAQGREKNPQNPVIGKFHNMGNTEMLMEL